MEKENVIQLLTWVKKNCTPRNTSRNNIWAHYWQLNNAGITSNQAKLLTDEELFNYWDTNIKDK